MLNNITMHNTPARKNLSPLERFLMDYVWAHPGCTAETCREGIASRKALKDSTIRTILRNLEEKGYVSHEVRGRTFVYRALDSRRSVAVEAALELVERFCGGSIEDLLVGLVDSQALAPKELERLAAKIAQRKETRA